MVAVAEGDRLDAAIRSCVRRAIAGEASLDTLITRLLYGRDPDPQHDREWPKEHRVIYFDAVRLWQVAQRDLKELRQPHGHFGARPLPRQPPPQRVWDAIIAGATSTGQPWLRGTHLRWGELALRLHMPTRSVIHLLEECQGWHFDGQGRARRCITAVCEQCSSAWSVVGVRERLCVGCAA